MRNAGPDRSPAPAAARPTTPRSGDAVAAAEEIGVDIVFNWDHFFPLYGDPDGKHFECWTMLGAWAEATERVEIGALVTCNSYRNPELLADMARTVDHISERPADPRHRRRAGSRRTTTSTATSSAPPAAGSTPSARRCRGSGRAGRSSTRRRRGEIPILIGGGGERKTLRLVAEHADIWHGFGEPAIVAHKHDVLDEWCRKVGRDPGEIERSCGANPAKPERELRLFVDARGHPSHLLIGWGGRTTTSPR